MEDNKSMIKTDGQLATSSGFPDLDRITKFVDAIFNSKTFNKGFLVKNEDTGKMEVDRDSIIACVILGDEMGIKPAAAIMLGNKLNRDSYFSVIKGRSLGIDPITSISKIYNITTQAGTIQSLAVDLITKAMLDAGCKLDYVRDFAFTPIYRTLADKLYVGHYYNICESEGDINPKYFVYSKDVPVNELQEAIKEGKIVITNCGYTHVTSLRVSRKNRDFDNIFHYSLQDAIEAGLYKGYSQTSFDAKGNPIYVTGRSNWNSHPAVMTRNRVNSIAGRIAVADILQGTYSHEEAMEIINVSKEEDLISPHEEVN